MNLSDLAKYSMTRSARCLSATAELLVSLPIRHPRRNIAITFDTEKPKVKKFDDTFRRFNRRVTDGQTDGHTDAIAVASMCRVCNSSQLKATFSQCSIIQCCPAWQLVWCVCFIVTSCVCQLDSNEGYYYYYYYYYYKF